ncbi:MAG: M15 family metallopeptidase, partial [Fulvivirga sp.]
MNIRTVLTFLLFITQAACEPQRTQEINFDKLGFNASNPKDEIEHQTESDTTFVVMQEYAEGFSYDMKYATDDNFLKRKVYSCDKCMIRKEVANKLIAANDSLINLGFRIKFFDCYRPV